MKTVSVLLLVFSSLCWGAVENKGALPEGVPVDDNPVGYESQPRDRLQEIRAIIDLLYLHDEREIQLTEDQVETLLDILEDLEFFLEGDEQTRAPHKVLYEYKVAVSAPWMLDVYWDDMREQTMRDYRMDREPKTQEEVQGLDLSQDNKK